MDPAGWTTSGRQMVNIRKKKDSEETLEVAELAEVEVDEEEVEWRAEGEAPFGEATWIQSKSNKVERRK